MRWGIVVAWVLLAGAMWVYTPRIDPAANEREQFLPEDTQYVQAVHAWTEAFGDQGGQSQAVVVFERLGKPLTDEDFAAIERVAGLIRSGDMPGDAPGLTPGDLQGITVSSPESVGVPKMPLVDEPIVPNPQVAPAGPNGQAAIIEVDLPSNFISLHADRVVRYLHELLAKVDLPSGLRPAVTGSAGFGSDYAQAAKTSYARTSQVTLVAVIVILLIVYRAPLAAVVPLASISLASVVVLKSLGIGEAIGYHTGTAERIFVFVLMYGAGVDYSLLLIGRFRESLQESLAPAEAVAKAVNASLPAILVSAGTDSAGLLMLSVGRFGIFATTGPAVAMSLIVAMAASLTLVPAMLAIFGASTFWPSPTKQWRAGSAKRAMENAWLWPRIAKAVTHRPVLILALVLLVVAAPAVRGSNILWLYDALSGFEPNEEKVGNATVGLEMAKRHWPEGEVAATLVLVQSQEPKTPEQWVRVAGRLTRTLYAQPGVSNVRTLSDPFGRSATPLQNFLARKFGGEEVRETYLSDDGRTLRVDVVLGVSPLTHEAMHLVEELRPKLQARLDEAAPQSELLLAGPTAEMIDVRDVTRRDMWVISSLTLGTIFLMVLLLLRDWLLSGFMVVATLISYFTTLGLTYWVVTIVLGQAGLDWKVQIFLFVVMVAVGQDYNIFLAARLAEESRRYPPREAVQRALVHTGPVISSCGIIMAATLGSLMVGTLGLMMQMGFALSMGMLVDTFVIRPLLLPSLAVLTGHTGQKGIVLR
ncbi:MAG: MMPL family transporter [Phycisphaerae bacterium]